MERLSVVVVGGGIGGLCAAIALRRAGCSVTVLEKSSFDNEVGQGLTISPNGGRILRDFGLDFEAAKLSDYLGSNFVRAETLEPLMPMLAQFDWEEKYGIAMKTAYRIDLHRALADLACSEEGGGKVVTLRPRATVTAYDGEAGTVSLQDGEIFHAHLIVVADGLRSQAPAYIEGPDCPQIDSSSTIMYRFTLPTEQIRSDPELSQLLSAGDGMCTFNVGAGMQRWLVRFYCRNNEITNFSLFRLLHDQGDTFADGKLRSQTERASLIEEVESFHPLLQKLATMTNEVLPLWRCTTREPLSRFHKGRLVIIGDAAHPVLPHQGLGAVSAIEDAAMLGVLFEKLPVASSEGAKLRLIEQRLELFSTLRVPRSAAYKYYSDIPHFQDPVTAQRDKVEQYMKPEELPATLSELRPFLVLYDAVADAKRALNELSAVTD